MGAVVRVDAQSPSPASLAAAREALEAGGVVVLPTDTVYGVAQAVCACPDGARALFELKRRPPEKAIPWLVDDVLALDVYGCDVPAYAHRLARAFWPGGMTLVVRASDAVPAAYLGAGATIALREPDAPVVRELARSLGCALATTSANTSGLPSPRSFEELEERIVAGAALTLDGGAVPVGVASTIVDCTAPEPRIVRHGAVPDADVMRVASQAAGL